MSPGRADDVDRPLPGDRGAHGDFDARARGWSAELWLRMNARRLVAATAAAAVLVAGYRAWTA